MPIHYLPLHLSLLLFGLHVLAPVPVSEPAAGVGPSITTTRSSTCFAAEPAIVGAPGQRVIHGTPGDDVIVGGPPVVKIYGHRGDDRICNHVRGFGNDTDRGTSGQRASAAPSWTSTR